MEPSSPQLREHLTESQTSHHIYTMCKQVVETLVWSFRNAEHKLIMALRGQYNLLILCCKERTWYWCCSFLRQITQTNSIKRLIDIQNWERIKGLSTLSSLHERWITNVNRIWTTSGTALLCNLQASAQWMLNRRLGNHTNGIIYT